MVFAAHNLYERTTAIGAALSHLLNVCACSWICLHRIAAIDVLLSGALLPLFVVFICALNFFYSAEFIGLIGQFCNNNYACNVQCFRGLYSSPRSHREYTTYSQNICIQFFISFCKIRYFLLHASLVYCFRWLWWFDHDHDCPRATESMHFLFLNWKRNSIVSIKMLEPSTSSATRDHVFVLP